MIPPELQPYLDISAALFPLPANTKVPHGIIQSWRHDWSRDRAQIEQWATDHPGCNWGMYAAGSGLIVADIDTKRIGATAAWSAWADVCRSWAIEPIPPTVSTPSGGWHVYLKLPRGVETEALRQPALVPAVIDIRANGFVLIPPSQIDGKQYVAYR